MAKYIQALKAFPVELFRVNNGRMINLRQYTGQRSFDIVTDGGMAKAKSLHPTTYEGKLSPFQVEYSELTSNTAPNGASMRPNTQFQRNLIGDYKGSQVVVYSIPAGTQLPDDLVLIHEFGDHYSLQAARDMPLSELNQKITTFLEAQGNVRSKEGWFQAYPHASAPSSSNNAQASATSSSSTAASTSSPWEWDENYRKYRRWDGNQWIWHE
ncbi:uncharacterized protein K460DRAFT_425937 [Cucurbitaria berberidis CBS 394.84]|uniref:Tse2 ADP-ribosyltransferase toxin domain-containing protein n=1 Tax=Cucurbitaria berberidis CBS 394.84 TaxID=1168544 RepID=A0A9P4L9J6_9PLEO|nr:uncharacterized protein K460DRAFT_425937 [Cucurbitaria berberidis CBS 394.84]KAF1847281.1 hypothetical protein K460DRAFT_425937 [Cucurbitaria berberidis CBS 394.84]